MNAVFTGRKRSGKTTLAFDIAMRREGGILIVDPKREWRDWPATANSVEQIDKFIHDGNDVIIFHPQGDKVAAVAPVFAYVTQLHNIAMLQHWEKLGYKFTLLVDEAVNFSDANFCDPTLLSLIAENRPEILDIYLTFQSPVDCNNRIKSRMDTWFIFNTSLPADLEYLSKRIGVPDEDLQEIKNLRPHEYAEFIFDGGTPVVKFDYNPDAWFRPMEFFELNKNEREEIFMARENKEEKHWLTSLIENGLDDVLDALDDMGYEVKKRRDERGERGGGNERSERSGNRNTGEYRLSGYSRK